MGLRATVLCALLVVAPLVGLPISFIAAPDALDQFSGFLPEAVAATAWILVGVGSGTLLQDKYCAPEFDAGFRSLWAIWRRLQIEVDEPQPLLTYG